MGGRAGGGASAGMGSRSRGGGGVDYLAQAGINDADIMKVLKTSMTKNAPTAEQIVKKKIAQKKKAIEDKKAFDFLVSNIEKGLTSRKQGKL